MNLITKDLLINFLIILLPLFLMQFLYQLKYAYRFEELKSWVLALFPVFTLIFCMMFPVGIGEGFSWDLRRIPLILGILYGGYKLGFVLLPLVVIIRYSMGGSGFYLTLLTISLTVVPVFFLSKYYAAMSLKQKAATSCSLIFLSVLLTAFMSERLFEVNMETTMWLQYILINVAGMLIATLLLEGIRNNFEVLQKLIKTEKLEVVSHLAASISHEVRNPLTVSRGFMQLSSDENLPSQTRNSYISTAIEELDRATDIINDYLIFAKPEIGIEETFTAAEEVQRVIDILTPLANMNSVQISTAFEKNKPGYMVGERKKFQQCLMNIMKNGIEAMPGGGTLRITISTDASAVHIHIQDEGIGMTKKQLQQLGEPYFSTKSQGTGLGMMVSFSIIKKMNGKIAIQSEKSKGTGVTISFPLAAQKPF